MGRILEVVELGLFRHLKFASLFAHFVSSFVCLDFTILKFFADYRIVERRCVGGGRSWKLVEVEVEQWNFLTSSVRLGLSISTKKSKWYGEGHS